ncbi:diguanylate cyclase [Desulfonatronovibrio magnus]|uniref:diguanylate cyclase n=1 Tax=Desulfonatronovibrio magnus TaxID=698827 RepID=UPI0005EBAC0D|nr:diguanylate cyclase [Desulfonatronovibrio magnus]
MDSNISRDIIKPLRDCLNLVFPPVMPQLIKEASKSSPDFSEMSKIVSIDPGLTVTIMSLANSPYYGLNQKVSDLKRAMVILGSAEILKLAISVTMKKSLTERLSKCEHLEYQNWAVILWSAMAAELLARELKLPQADSLYVCAMVKDLSLLLLCCSDDPRLKKYASLCRKEKYGLLTLRPHQLEEEESHWGVNHTFLTMDLLSSWGFPRSECELLISHHDLENIKDHDSPARTLILATYWAEVEMSENNISQLFRVRSIARNILGLDEDAFERVRSTISTRFKTMCQSLSISSNDEEIEYHNFPVVKIQDLYFAAQELQDVQGDLYHVVRTILKQLHWLWGIDEFEIALLSPMTGEMNHYFCSRANGVEPLPNQTVDEDRLDKAGIHFYLQDKGYIKVSGSLGEETVAEVDLYINFLTRTFEAYYYRTMSTTCKAMIMDSLPVAVARVSSAGKILQTNNRFKEIFSLDAEPGDRQFWELAAELTHIPDDETWNDFLSPNQTKYSKLFCPLETRMENSHEPCWHLSAHKVSVDGVLQILVLLEDITEVTTLEKDVFRQSEQLRGIVNSMQDLVFIVDKNGIIQFVSPQYKKELTGKNFFNMAQPSSILGLGWGPDVLNKTEIPIEVNLIMNSTSKSLELICTPLSGTSSPRYLIVGRDLTAIRRLEAKIKKQATFDHLTRVFNRHQFAIFLERETQRAVRKNLGLGLVFFDLDMFKEFNDRYGHQAGDEALRSFGRLLINNSRRGMDYPFRFGGDEFVLLITETDAKRLEELVKRFIKSFESDFDYNVSLSIGLAIMQDGESKEELLGRADKALFAAKKNPGNSYIWA